MEELQLHVVFQSGSDYLILTESVSNDLEPKWGVLVNPNLKRVTPFEDFRRMIKFVPYEFVPREEREGLLAWIRQHFGQEEFIERVVSPLMNGFSKEAVGYLEPSSKLINGSICKNCQWKGCEILKAEVPGGATCNLWLEHQDKKK